MRSIIFLSITVGILSGCISTNDTTNDANEKNVINLVDSILIKQGLRGDYTYIEVKNQKIEITNKDMFAAKTASKWKVVRATSPDYWYTIPVYRVVPIRYKSHVTKTESVGLAYMLVEHGTWYIDLIDGSIITDNLELNFVPNEIIEINGYDKPNYLQVISKRGELVEVPTFNNGLYNRKFHIPK